MKKIKMLLIVVVFAVIASMAIPAGVLNFTAAETILRQVTIDDQSETVTFLTQAETVYDAFLEMGIELNSFDRLSHSTTSLLWDGITITIEREISFNIQIDDGEEFSRIARPGITIGGVLFDLQDEFDINLLYSGNHTRQVASGETLEFLTWVSWLDEDPFYVPFETIENYTDAVSRGHSHVRQVGVDGISQTTTAFIAIGGREITSEYMGTTVLSEPIDEIIDIGTGWLGSLTDTSREDFHYFRRVRMEATAYTAGFSCTGKHPDDPWYRITASGREVQHGIVAVDRNVIPLGTRLYVEGYGFALAADVGGAIRGYKIDLFMEEIEDALRFGRRHLYVWILDEI